MGQKKITYWEAQSIANRIAKKAFEHVVNPLEERLQIELQNVYDTMLHRLNIDVQALRHHKVLGFYSNVNILFDDGDDEGRLVLGENRRWDKVQELPYAFEELSVTDENLIFQAKETNAQLVPLLRKRSEMENDVRGQLSGKSASTVCKNWPEVSGFVRDYFKMVKESDMTVPFESLVAKYLLALPAPETAEA